MIVLFGKKSEIINLMVILNIVFGGSNISNDDNKGLELAIKIFNFMHENLKIKFIVSFFGSQIIDD